MVANNNLIYYWIMKSRKMNAYLNRETFIDILISNLILLNNARRKYKKKNYYMNLSFYRSIELFRFAVDILFKTLRHTWHVYDNSFTIKLNYSDNSIKSSALMPFWQYRGSLLSTNSLSTIPEVVRVINSTKSVNSPK